MPIYEEEGKLTREDLLDLRKRNSCKECGGSLNVFLDPDSGKAFLACWDWLRTHHEGIERGASRYEIGGLSELTIQKRREIMDQNYGKEKSTALAKLPMTGALTQPQAMHILKLVYPDVPEDQIVRTAILCRDFGLHPLMKEVYIIGFENKKTGKTDYSSVLGIGANRKMAADKKGAYSFLDLSPRVATKEEIIQQFGPDSEEEKGNLISITKLKGEKGNEAVGFGLWPKNETPKAFKGNTKRNMANIRSERQALDRLPGEAIPLRHLDVIDGTFIEVADVGKVAIETGEITEQKPEPTSEALVPDPKEHWCEEHNCAFELKTSRFGTFYAHKDPDGKWCNEKKKEPVPATAETTQPEQTVEPEESQQAKRNPDTIKTINDLYKACNKDFNLQPADVIKELGVSSQSDISDTPAECYQKIAAVR